jgi:hypothetical protein
MIAYTGDNLSTASTSTHGYGMTDAADDDSTNDYCVASTYSEYDKQLFMDREMRIVNHEWDPAPREIKVQNQSVLKLKCLLNRRISPPFWTGRNYRKVKK